MRNALSPSFQGQWMRECLRVCRQCRAPLTLEDMLKMMKGIPICYNSQRYLLNAVKIIYRRNLIIGCLSHTCSDNKFRRHVEMSKT